MACDQVLETPDEIGAVGTWLEWGTWLAAHGEPDLKPAAALHFGSYEQVIGAAVSGQGIAMGIGRLIGHLLQSGQLVAPLGQSTDEVLAELRDHEEDRHVVYA